VYLVDSKIAGSQKELSGFLWVCRSSSGFMSFYVITERLASSSITSSSRQILRDCISGGKCPIFISIKSAENGFGGL